MTDTTRSLAEVSADIRDLTIALNNALSEGVSMHGLRLDIQVDQLTYAQGGPTIPKLRIDQFKRIA